MLRHNNNQGFALLFVFFFVILVALIVVAYLELTYQSTSDFAANREEAQAFYAAEAAQARAVQYLQNNWAGIWNTLQPNNGALGSYTLAPLETLAVNTSISYEFIVDNWNLADSTKPAPFGIASVASNVNWQGGNIPADAVDGAMNTNWRTVNNPSPPLGEGVRLIIQFPAGSNYTINEIRVRRQGNPPVGRPTAYTWQTSTTGILGSYTTQYTRAVDAGVNQWYDFFPVAATNVNFLMWDITGWNGNRVDIDEIEIPWIRIKTKSRNNSRVGLSYSEKYIRSCVLTNSRTAPATITKILPSTLPNTNVTAIWDTISYDTYTTPSDF